MSLYKQLSIIFAGIPAEKWTTNSLLNKHGQRCAIGHIPDQLWIDFNLSRKQEAMKELIDVNDGDHPDYKQATPKERTIQYCNDKAQSS